MQKALRVTATTAIGMTLLSCTAPPAPVAYAPPPPMAYEPLPPVVRAPLPPPVGYAPPPPIAFAPPEAYPTGPGAPYGSSTYARAEPPPAAEHLVWRASPRWATVKKDPQAKFKAAQAKAANVGVENLTKDDIDGLNAAQIKELRGY